MVKRYCWSVLLVCAFFSCTSSENTSKDNDSLFTLLSPSESGVDFKNPVKETEKNNHLNNDMLISGAGVAVGDINNDGLPDLYFTGNQVQDRLYLNKGNLEFEDISDDAGILSEKIWSSGATFADINNDGYQDIYVCKYTFGKEHLSENLLYINNGDNTFSERGKEYGLADRGFSVQASFFDFDLDGVLDLYLINQPPSTGKRKGNKITLSRLNSTKYTDKIFRVMGGSEYYNVTNYCLVENLAFGLSATMGDFNNDGWTDIYIANDYERPDHLYINQKTGQYYNQANTALKHMSNFSMGVDAADYDNDGSLDLIVVDMAPEDHKRIKTNMGGMNPQTFWDNVDRGFHYQYMFNTLQRNNGNGTFSDVAQLAGVSSTDWSWSALFADLDNDGWKDLFITNGVKRAMRNSDLEGQYNRVFDSLEVIAKQEGKEIEDYISMMDFVEMSPVERLPNYAFKNNGDLTFSKKMKDWGLDLPGLSYGSAYADLDLDGDLELIINNMDDYAHIYKNNTVEKGLGNYITFDIKNAHGSPAIGTRIKLYKDGEFWQMVEMTNARGYKSKSQDLMHFGLGKDEVVEKVEVIWPDGLRHIMENVPANQLVKLDYSKAEKIPYETDKPGFNFRTVTDDLNIKYLHKENDYDDYAREVLLPHKMSNFGPGLATGDVNGDGLDDFYVGGAAGYAGQLFIQQKDGKFSESEASFLDTDKDFEDLGAAIFDADGDGDQDLYIVSGGNEFEAGSEMYQDRLYLNNGSGRFTRSQSAIPQFYTSGSVVVPGDYDADGDLDLFVGGRLLPGQYPKPADSHVLRNDGGKFVDVTPSVAPMLLEAGLVTSAVWSDQNNDGKLDLIVTGEWMPVTILEQDNLGSFVNKTEEYGLSENKGWFYGLAVADLDKDGNEDIIAGNLGLNYKYKASEEEPFEVYSHDFDNNGSLDIVLSYYEHGHAYPVRGRSCSSQQIPDLKEKFPTFESFGEADLTDVYGEELNDALNLQATNFASQAILNRGNGKYEIMPLPNMAQFSSINNIIIDDFNQDDHLDLVISGNLYASEIETPRNDAGIGLYLTGNGTGEFEPVPLMESGFFAPHDAKDMKMLEVNGQRVVLVAYNQYYLQAIEVLQTTNDQLVTSR